MAWLEVDTDVGAKAAGRAKYSVALKHGGARVSVPKHIVDQLGWKKTATFKLLVGAGEMDGKLRLEPSDGGRIAAKTAPGRGAAGLLVRLGRWPQLAPRDVDAVAVDHEIDKAALVITLPRHAVMAAPPPPIPRATVPAPPTAGKRDVTSQFFNDPKPKAAMTAGTRGITR
ncbi:MAG: hypothetical protein U1E23_09435 [Reyranellaceae bacterium]